MTTAALGDSGEEHRRLADVGLRLQRWRVRQDLQQKDVAAAAGLSPSHLSHLEKGRKPVSPEALERLMEAVELPQEERPQLRTALREHLGALGSRAARATSPSLRVGDLPLATLRYVDPFDVALVDDEQPALDPAAEVWDRPASRPLIRVYRDRDGRLLLDRSAGAPAPQARWDRTRHTLRPEGLYRLPIDPELWRDYARTRIAIRAGSSTIVCERSERRPTGGYPTWEELGAANRPGPLRRIYVLTAWNAGWQLLGKTANARAHRLLGSALRDAGGLVLGARLEAQSDGVRFAEDGYAVAGVSTETVAALARDFGQSSFFSWTPRERQVVPADETTEGWTHRWRRVS